MALKEGANFVNMYYNGSLKQGTNRVEIVLEIQYDLQ
jgi:hypothetical protein